MFWAAKMLKLESAKKTCFRQVGCRSIMSGKKMFLEIIILWDAIFQILKKHVFHILESDCFQIPKSGFFLLFDSDFFLILKACFFLYFWERVSRFQNHAFFIFFKSVFLPDSQKHVFVIHKSIKTIFPPPYPKTS